MRQIEVAREVRRRNIPAVILFARRKFTMAEIHLFLRKNKDLGVRITRIQSVRIRCVWYYRSIQWKHNGEFSVYEDPLVPGLKLLFGKSKAKKAGQ